MACMRNTPMKRATENLKNAQCMAHIRYTHNNNKAEKQKMTEYLTQVKKLPKNKVDEKKEMLIRQKFKSRGMLNESS